MIDERSKYIHKKNGFCKAIQEHKEEPQTPVQDVKPAKSITRVTDSVVNQHIENNPDIVSNHLRN